MFTKHILITTIKLKTSIIDFKLFCLISLVNLNEVKISNSLKKSTAASAVPSTNNNNNYWFMLLVNLMFQIDYFNTIIVKYCCLKY